MTGFKSKKTAALDEEGMYLVHHTEPAQEPKRSEWKCYLFDNPIHEAMLAYWGERCPDYHKECVCCQAWEQYDGKTSAQPVQDATMQSLKDLKRSVCDEVGKAAFAQPAQELVKYKCTVIDDQHPQGIPLEQWGNTGKAQRTWVDLTPQDYAEIFRTARNVDHAARLATAKLKEKNNG